MQFTFTMEDHVQTRVNGSQFWASVGLLFNEMRLWVGQYAFTAVTDLTSLYSDVSVNMGPYCPRVYYYKDDVIEEAERVSDIIDDIVGIYEKKEKDRINRLLDEIVAASERNISATPKPLRTTNKNSAIKLKLGKLSDIKKPEKGELYVHKMMKAERKSLDLAMNTIVKAGDHLGIRMKHMKSPAYRNALLDGRIPREYTYTAAAAPLHLTIHFCLLCFILSLFLLY